MDKLRENEKKSEDKGSGRGFFGRLSAISGSAKEKRREDKHALVTDLALFVLGFVLSRRHIVFGARPLGTALVALMPVGVWQTLGGALAGSLSLGGEGVGGAISVAVAVALRLFLSSTETRLFSESLLLRMSASLLGGFASAVYRAIALGLGGGSILFGVFSIALPPLFVFMLSGLFGSGISISELLRGEKNPLSLKGKNERERCTVVFFGFSAALFLYLISLSFAEYELFGIGFAEVFAGVVTLISAKRLGALTALAVGFASSLGSAGIFSVSFALVGLVAGLAFGFGVGYAVIGGGAALSAWSGYSAGLLGLLSTLPEYSIAVLISLPLLKKVSPRSEEPQAAEESARSKDARDMVGTMALSFRASRSSGMDALEDALTSLSSVVRESTEQTPALTPEDCEALVLECADEECASCDSRALCKAEKISPCKKNASAIARQLALGEGICAEDINTDTEFCARAEALTARIAARRTDLFRERHTICSKLSVSLEYALISRLISEARREDEAEREIDAELSATLGTLVSGLGLSGAVIRAFGKRKKHFIMALEDKDGKKITSPELKRTIEEAAGVKLGVPEYFRHGNMALMECTARRAFVAECATASLASGKLEVSGDTVCTGEAAGDRFFAVISDGMGSGAEAKRTSRLCTELLKPLIGIGAEHETVIHLLNTVLKRRAGECSATLDLFLFDLITGEGGFIKSGAAASYIKRDGSVFRIKSHTAPLGLIDSVDAEKIRADVRDGDLVILLSDGVCGSSEDPAWLLELLSAPVTESLSVFADSIVRHAKKSSDSRDDMSAAVIRIRAL